MTTNALTPAATASNIPPRILVIGGGYVGMFTAQRILKQLKRGEAVVTVVDPRPYMTYQPFLPEAAAGSIAPRNLVAPLRRVLKGPNAEVITGRVVSVDHSRKSARIAPNTGGAYELSFDQLVVAVGSVPRTLPIPGLAEHGIGFKQVEEAISLRNHVIGQIDLADSIQDPALRRKALTFVFVGGGFAGVEAIAEMEDMARDVSKWYDNVEPEDMRWLLVEAADRILPEVGPELGVWTAEELRKRGIQIKMKTFLNSCVDNHVVLSDGTELDASTVVWTAGVKPNPVVAQPRHPARPEGPRGRAGQPARHRFRPRVGGRRLRAGAGPVQEPGQLVLPVRAARGSSGQAARREHRGVAARQDRPGLRAQARRFGGRPRHR